MLKPKLRSTSLDNAITLRINAFFNKSKYTVFIFCSDFNRNVIRLLVRLLMRQCVSVMFRAGVTGMCLDCHRWPGGDTLAVLCTPLPLWASCDVLTGSFSSTSCRTASSLSFQTGPAADSGSFPCQENRSQ